MTALPSSLHCFRMCWGFDLISYGEMTDTETTALKKFITYSYEKDGTCPPTSQFYLQVYSAQVNTKVAGSSSRLTLWQLSSNSTEGSLAQLG